MDVISLSAKQAVYQANPLDKIDNSNNLTLNKFSADVAHFQFLMNDGNTQVRASHSPIVNYANQTSTDNPFSINNTIVSLPKDPVSTIGDKILDSLRTTSNQISSSWQQVSTLANQDTFSMTNVVQAQAALVTASLEFDLVGKVVSKTTQNIDQLIKLQ